jgi:hypothetical protein
MTLDGGRIGIAHRLATNSRSRISRDRIEMRDRFHNRITCKGSLSGLQPIGDRLLRIIGGCVMLSD